ncbi:MAG TPA: RcnB family protein [Allosphingosinicella sp.]|jgi:Ni/Co efflux regulator RcnB|nr:RcnB family protein [Allosphingosinicella sp.]
MSKLALYILAASAAFIPAAASAQMHHPGGTAVTVRHGGPGMGMGHHGRFMHPGPNFRHHRLHRGFVINPFWFGPQFHIQNWQMYGFAPPPSGHRWVRYYDDAYLIDREGRVRDERYGLDWDQYGERWDMDDGIPAYYGRGDYRPDDEDYGWVERHGGGGEDWDYGDAGAGYGPPPECGRAPVPCGGGGGYGAGYGYGGGYGYYGYGVAYPIIIETTVTTGAASYVEEVTEEVVEVRSRARRARPRPHCNCPPPRRPPPGERG